MVGGLSSHIVNEIQHRVSCPGKRFATSRAASERIRRARVAKSNFTNSRVARCGAGRAEVRTLNVKVWHGIDDLTVIRSGWLLVSMKQESSSSYSRGCSCFSVVDTKLSNTSQMKVMTNEYKIIKMLVGSSKRWSFPLLRFKEYFPLRPKLNAIYTSNQSLPQSGRITATSIVILSA